MGANFPEDKKAIDLALALPREVKEYLGHHLNNSMVGIINGIETGNYERVKKSAWHMVEDLRRIGINNCGRRWKNKEGR